MRMAAAIKSVLLIRHGVTEMNEYLGSTPYGMPGFVDPGLFDTRLTERGRRQAEGLQQWLSEEHTRQPFDLVISSPLTRALATADIALGPVPARCDVDPDLAERCWLSSDVGRAPSEVAQDFPRFAKALGSLNDEWWWEGDRTAAEAAKGARLTLQGAKVLEGVALAVEPSDHFLMRVQRFRDRLLAADEKRIVVFAHWGVFYALTGGRSMRNCEVVVCTAEELRVPLKAPPD